MVLLGWTRFIVLSVGCTSITVLRGLHFRVDLVLHGQLCCNLTELINGWNSLNDFFLFFFIIIRLNEALNLHWTAAYRLQGLLFAWLVSAPWLLAHLKLIKVSTITIGLLKYSLKSSFRIACTSLSLQRGLIRTSKRRPAK